MDPILRDEVFVSKVGEVPPLAAVGLNAFLLEVHRWCVRWLERNQAETGNACAFVLSDRLDLDPVYEEHASEFIACGRLDVAPPSGMPGPIVLTSSNLRLALSHHCREPHVSGIARELKELGLGVRPTVIFVPPQRTLTFYANGVDNKASMEANAGTLRSLDPTDVKSLLHYFHENWTRYPDGYGPCWDNPGERIVERNAERNVRNSLFVFLSMVVYRSQYVAREHQLPNGRADILIYGIVLGDEMSHRVLELKVLRSRSIGWQPGKGKVRTYSDAGNKRYVERGLRQAQRYKSATNAAEAFLCCFDARLTNSEIDVHDYAKALDVCYCRYFMESSASEN